MSEPAKLEHYTHRFVKWSGTSHAFVFALCAIAVVFLLSEFYWGAGTAGSLLNTFTSLVTFLLIFVMQRSQNKEFKSIQVKLNELISTQQDARNELINIENSSEEHIQMIHEQHESRK